MTIAEKLTTIAENEQRVYNAGYNAGKALNYNEGFTDGKQAEYDAFWNSYQDNGNRLCGFFMFAGVGWNSENFKPKYKLAIAPNKYPTYSTSMFERFDNLLKKPPLEINEGDIDFSQATILERTFTNANVSKVEMDCIPPNLTQMTGTFLMNSIARHQLTTLKLGVNASTAYDTYCFTVGSLEDVSFIEGSVIGKSVDFAKCVELTKTSQINIMSVLSPTALGQTLTLPKVAVDKAFETSEGANDGSTSAEWKTLVDTKSNWTIALK